MEEKEQEVLEAKLTSGRAAAELKEMLKDVDREITSLDAVRRMLLTGAIRQQSGMSIEDWLRAAESLETLMQVLAQPGRIEDPDKRRSIVTMLTEWKERLKRLASCFQMASQLANHYVKDQDQLAKSKEVLAYRQQVIHALITEIEQIT